LIVDRESAEAFPSTIIINRQRTSQLLRQEKDEASPPNCFRRDSLNAFIRRFDGSEGFYFSPALVSQSKIRFANPFAKQH
jgi:hypothetical protein